LQEQILLLPPVQSSLLTKITNLETKHNNEIKSTNTNVTKNANDISALNKELDDHLEYANSKLDYLTYMLNQILATTESGKFNVRRGRSKYPSKSGKTTITHGFGSRPQALFIHTEDNTEGKLGEVWANFDESTITVSNSGTSTANFYYTAFIGTSEDSENYIKSGYGNYTGNSKCTKIEHKLGKAPEVVEVFPTAKPNGTLGEYWVTTDDVYIYVYNSGSFTGQFYWCAMIRDNSNDVSLVKTGKFGGTASGTYNKVTIPHNLGVRPLIVSVVPTVNTGKLVGEISITTDKNNIYIVNTGLSTCSFTCYIYNTELSEKTDTYLRYADSGMTDQDGYWDRGSDVPTGETPLNYSGNLGATMFNSSIENIGIASEDNNTPNKIAFYSVDTTGVVHNSQFTYSPISSLDMSSSSNILYFYGITASEAGFKMGNKNANSYYIVGGIATVEIISGLNISVNDIIKLPNNRFLRVIEKMSSTMVKVMILP